VVPAPVDDQFGNASESLPVEPSGRSARKCGDAPSGPDDHDVVIEAAPSSLLRPDRVGTLDCRHRSRDTCERDDAGDVGREIPLRVRPRGASVVASCYPI
jgi:hypothetical protein